MLTKLLLLNCAKVAFVTSVGELLMVATPLGLPLGSTWFDGFVWGWGSCTILGVIVSSMLEPDENSSPAYVFAFRFGHALTNRLTIYATHRSFWRIFIKAKREAEEEQRLSE